MSDQLGSTDCAEHRAGRYLDFGLEPKPQTRQQNKLGKAVVALLRATSDADEHEPPLGGPRD